MRQILLFAALAAVLALLLVSCGGTKDKPVPTEEDAPGKAAYHKISAEEAYEMMISAGDRGGGCPHPGRNTMAGILKTPSLCPTTSIGSEMPETLPDKEATLLIYCRSGRRSKDAAQKLLALGYQSVYDFDTILIVQIQFKVMVDDGQLEPDGLQPLSIRLAFRADLHLVDQNFHQSAAFRLGHGGIKLVKANQDLIDVVTCDFVSFNGLLLCPDIHQSIFHLFDFIVHLIKAVVKVGFSGDKVPVVRVKAVDLLHKPGFCGVVLPQLLLIGGDLLLNGSGIYLHV